MQYLKNPNPIVRATTVLGVVVWCASWLLWFGQLGQTGQVDAFLQGIIQRWETLLAYRQYWPIALGLVITTLLPVFWILGQRWVSRGWLVPRNLGAIRCSLGYLPGYRPLTLAPRIPQGLLKEYPKLTRWLSQATEVPAERALAEEIIRLLLTHPHHPAAPVPQGHGGRTLLAHTLAVTERGLAALETGWTFQELGHPANGSTLDPEEQGIAVLALLAHDLGKLSWQLTEQGWQKTRISHDRLSLRWLARCPSFWRLAPYTRRLLAAVVAHQHRRTALPIQSGRAEVILAFTQHIDVSVSKEEGTTALFATGERPPAAKAGVEQAPATPDETTPAPESTAERVWQWLLHYLAQPGVINGRDQERRAGFKGPDGLLYLNEPQIRHALARECFQDPLQAEAKLGDGRYQLTTELLTLLAHYGVLVTRWRDFELSPGYALFRIQAIDRKNGRILGEWGAGLVLDLKEYLPPALGMLAPAPNPPQIVGLVFPQNAAVRKQVQLAKDPATASPDTSQEETQTNTQENPSVGSGESPPEPDPQVQLKAQRKAQLAAKLPTLPLPAKTDRAPSTPTAATPAPSTPVTQRNRQPAAARRSQTRDIQRTPADQDLLQGIRDPFGDAFLSPLPTHTVPETANTTPTEPEPDWQALGLSKLATHLAHQAWQQGRRWSVETGLLLTEDEAWELLVSAKPELAHKYPHWRALWLDISRHPNASALTAGLHYAQPEILIKRLEESATTSTETAAALKPEVDTAADTAATAQDLSPLDGSGCEATVEEQSSNKPPAAPAGQATYAAETDGSMATAQDQAEVSLSPPEPETQSSATSPAATHLSAAEEPTVALPPKRIPADRKPQPNQAGTVPGPLALLLLDQAQQQGRHWSPETGLRLTEDEAWQLLVSAKPELTRKYPHWRALWLDIQQRPETQTLMAGVEYGSQDTLLVAAPRGGAVSYSLPASHASQRRRKS